jgi:hypothetical protein
VVDGPPICETFGHTRDWHDREAERFLRGSDPPIERHCYREVGGAACGCGGFRESGTFAVRPDMRSSRPGLALRAPILVLLLVVLGLALLYLYRSQTPSTPQVDVTQAVRDVNAGRIRAVVIAGNRVTLEFSNGPAYREQTTIPEPDAVIAPAVARYNAANPSRAIDLRYTQDGQGIGLVGPIVLSLVPILLIGGIVYYLLVRSRRRS